MEVEPKIIIKSNMEEGDIRLLVRQEIAQSFEQLVKDVNALKESNRKLEKGMERIERVLVGDKDMQDIGYAEMIRYSYERSKSSAEKHLVERGECAINFVESWEKEGRWKILREIVDRYSAIKWLTALIISSGVISVANVVSLILDLLAGK